MSSSIRVKPRFHCRLLNNLANAMTIACSPLLSDPEVNAAPLPWPKSGRLVREQATCLRQAKTVGKFDLFRISYLESS
jgi:hypothetical protein